MDILSTETSKAAIRSLMAMFSRYGVPDSPQDLALHCQNLQNLLVSETFDMSIRVPAISEEQWKTENGLAPLETSSTPCEGMDTSPAQRVFDCHCKTLVDYCRPLKLSGNQDLVLSLMPGSYLPRRKGRGNSTSVKRSLAPLKSGKTVRVLSPRGTWNEVYV